MVQSKLLGRFKDLHHFFFEKEDRKESFKIDDCYSVQQIHSNKVVVVDSQSKYDKLADGMVTKDRIFLEVRTADCLPIFFFDPEESTISAVHAGWRGIKDCIIKNAVAEMKKMGSNCQNIISVIGPHIKSCCYSVSSARLEEFDKKFQVCTRDKKSLFLDLEKIAYRQLKDEGIESEHIDILPFCTSCDKRFYSYRREGAETGRLSSLIGFSPKLNS